MLANDTTARRATVNGVTVSADEIIENAVIQLDYADKALACLWERYFGMDEAPADWDALYHEIATQMTAFKFLLDRITDDLLSTYNMASDFHAAALSVLHRGATNENGGI